MRGNNVRRRWWSDAVAAAELFLRAEMNAAGEPITLYDFKLHELRHTAASLAIQAGANIKAPQNTVLPGVSRVEPRRIELLTSTLQR